MLLIVTPVPSLCIPVSQYLGLYFFLLYALSLLFSYHVTRCPCTRSVALLSQIVVVIFELRTC